MCLITNHGKPIVAQRDIKVYKHVLNIVSNIAISPYQRIWFNLNKEFIAEPSETHLYPCDNIDNWEINAGAIHACLWPDFGIGRCLEAYIPKGVEYWRGVDKTTVCAKKLFVTDKEVKPEDCAGMDEEMAYATFWESPRNNKGITIGSFLVSNNFVSPLIAANNKEDIQGIVVGFNNNNEPVVADIQHIKRHVSIDNYTVSKLHKYVHNIKGAIQDMNGYEHTEIWKNTCKDKPDRYEAFCAIDSSNKNYYIPALGEIELVWKNLTYIAASCSIAHIACPFTVSTRYWTSTEFSPSSCWYSGLHNDGANSHCGYKSIHLSLLPFVHLKLNNNDKRRKK